MGKTWSRSSLECLQEAISSIQLVTSHFKWCSFGWQQLPPVCLRYWLDTWKLVYSSCDKNYWKMVNDEASTWGAQNGKFVSGSRMVNQITCLTPPSGWLCFRFIFIRVEKVLKFINPWGILKKCCWNVNWKPLLECTLMTWLISAPLCQLAAKTAWAYFWRMKAWATDHLQAAKTTYMNNDVISVLQLPKDTKLFLHWYLEEW